MWQSIIKGIFINVHPVCLDVLITAIPAVLSRGTFYRLLKMLPVLTVIIVKKGKYGQEF